LRKGESSREKVRWQILKFLLNGSATSTRIVEVCDASKVTVYKYLNELCDDGEVVWKPHRKRGKSIYELSDEAKEEVKLLVEKHEIKEKVDYMTPQKTQELKKFLDSLVKGEEFWVWPQGIHHSKEIIKYKAEKKTLRQD